jgi:hypothetical protein
MYRMTAKVLSEMAGSVSRDKARVVRVRFISAFETIAAGSEAAEEFA